MGEYKRKRSRVRLILCPIQIFWCCVKLEAENPLYRYMRSGEGHWTIHRDRKKETCLNQICNNLMMITLNLKTYLRSYFSESEANVILKHILIGFHKGTAATTFVIVGEFLLEG
jgi:hypothetical protein